MKSNLRFTLPVFMSFIVMGFVDLVGVITAYVQEDFQLSDNIAQLIPMVVFVWFFLLSVPTGILQDKIGKKRMLNIGMGLTAVGMLIPLLSYSFPVILASVFFLGVSNTVVQVSANPLMHDVAPRGKYSSYMSLAQFVKAVCSLMGPIITTSIAAAFGDWKLVFLVYLATSVLAILWLYLTRIEELEPERKPATFASCFSLVKNRFILMMVLAIFMIVGADVGMNTNIVNYLTTAHGLPLDKASLGISIYFTAVMIGRFTGAVLLNWIKPRKFLFWTVVLALGGVALMILSHSALVAGISIFIIGLGAANTFPLVFAISIEKMPERDNEISGLMIMAISGGAILPPVMGLVSTQWGVIPSLFVIAAAFIYVLLASLHGIRK